MRVARVLFFTFLFVLASIVFKYVETRPAQYNFHSDAIVTHWPTPAPDIDKGKGDVDGDEENQPGFMRRQLIKFGKVASNIGNAMGTHATKITSAIDKICEVVKTVIPLLAAVCHVGQFKFCAATTEAPEKLSEALSPSNLDLNIPD